MPKATWALALVAVLALVGIASAQPAPAVAPVSSPGVQPPPVVTPEVAANPAVPAFDLSQIFEAPATSGTSLNPEPIWNTCTHCAQPCFQECRASFCNAVCINMTTCICGCSCP